MGEAEKSRQLDVKALLAEHFLLRHLPAADLEKIGAYARIRKLKSGETVFLKGDKASSMMVVASGRVRISSNSPDGKEVTLNIINPGEVFGEIALIDGDQRTADAVAVEKTELLTLSRGDFLPYLEKNPDVSLDLLKMLCHRLRTTSEQLEDFSFLDLRRRLAKRLLLLAEQHGRESGEIKGELVIDMHLTQSDLGAMTGATREAVNKQLRIWENEGLIKLGRASVTLLGRAGLEAVSRETD